MAEKKTKIAKRASGGVTTKIAKMAASAQLGMEKLKKNIREQNSMTRTITVDATSSVLAQTADQLLQWAVRALSEYSSRTQGPTGHFAKHVAVYSSVPQTVFGFLFYTIEMISRGREEELKISLGREIAHSASLILSNLGLSNSIRALRFYLSTKDEAEQKNQKEKDALLTKLGELTKKLDQAKQPVPATPTPASDSKK